MRVATISPADSMKREVHIALSADHAYSVPLALCLYSLQQTATPGTEYHYHILDSGVDRPLISAGDFEHISWYPVADQLCELPENKRYPTAIYHRYLLPQILPESVKRVLYLDCDTFIRRDLSELYFTDMGSTPIAATPWLVMGADRQRYESFLRSFPERFNLPDDGLPYCFSSQLLMDLDALRALNAAQQLTDMTLRFADKLIYPDQDVINAFFRGRITYLPQKYNVIPAFATETELNHAEIRSAYECPAIIHFASVKPNILTGPRNAMEEEFFRFWKKSPWSRHIPYPLISLAQFPLPCVAAVLRAFIRFLIPYPRLLRMTGSLLERLRQFIRKA